LPLTIDAGSSTTMPFYYLDTRSGAQTLTASATGVTSGAQTMTVLPGPAVSVAVTPRSAPVAVRSTKELSAFAIDSFGNRFPALASWSLAPQARGTLSTGTGNSTSFTASRRVGRGTVTAVVDTGSATLSAAASMNVVPARMRVALAYQGRKRAFFVSLLATDPAGHSVSRARIAIVVRRNGRLFYSKVATTGAAGRVSVRVLARRAGCFTTTISRVTALGFTWDHRMRRNRYCRS